MLGVTVDSFSEPELGARGGGEDLVKKISWGEAPPQSLTPYRFIHNFLHRLSQSRSLGFLVCS